MPVVGKYHLAHKLNYQPFISHPFYSIRFSNVHLSLPYIKDAYRYVCHLVLVSIDRTTGNVFQLKTNDTILCSLAGEYFFSCEYRLVRCRKFILAPFFLLSFVHYISNSIVKLWIGKYRNEIEPNDFVSMFDIFIFVQCSKGLWKIWDILAS